MSDVDTILDQYEEAWQQSSTPPEIVRFLGDQLCVDKEMFWEIVQIDLAYRWRGDCAPSNGLPRRPLIEDYVRLVPTFPPLLSKLQDSLSPGDIPTAALCSELRVRWDSGDHPTVESYRLRFLDWNDARRKKFAAVHAELMQEQPPTEWSALLENAAITSQELGERLRKSRLVSRDEIQSAWDSLDKEGRSPLGLAQSLVDQNKVTPSQLRILVEDESTPLVLGTYVIKEKIGEGGMGCVYRALHGKMQREVALKVISPQVVKDEASIRRFNREVQAVARLSHPNIVTAHDAGAERGNHYLVMEYIVGSDLASLVRNNGSLPIHEALNYTRQAAVGLAYAHDQGIVHRDVKPTNLLLDETGTVKILDMGLARLEQESNEPPVEGLTETGVVMGTVDYMAPEQAFDSKTADARSDIYSLGCTMFFLLTGRTMFQGDTVLKRFVAHREQPAPRLSEELKHIHLPYDDFRAFDEMFGRMVAKERADRFSTMHNVVHALDSALASVPTTNREDRQVALQKSASSHSDTHSSAMLDETVTIDERQANVEDAGTNMVVVNAEKPIARVPMYLAFLFTYDLVTGIVLVLLGVGSLDGALHVNPLLAVDVGIVHLLAGSALLLAGALLVVVPSPRYWKTAAVSHGVTVLGLLASSWSMWRVVAEVGGTRRPEYWQIIPHGAVESLAALFFIGCAALSLVATVIFVRFAWARTSTSPAAEGENPFK